MDNSKKQIQKLLEKSACKRNGGICESYEYCKFCAEPTKIYRKSDTPCADAFFNLKEVNKMIKEYYKNKEYVKIGQERIKLWEKEYNTHYNDEEYLAEWYDTLKVKDTFGMPKAKGLYISSIDQEIERKENARRKIKQIISLEKSRVNSTRIKVDILSQAFEKFNEREGFLLQLLLSNYKMADILLSYEKQYGKMYSETGMKKKIAIIKKKIWINYKKIQKSTLFSEKGML